MEKQEILEFTLAKDSSIELSTAQDKAVFVMQAIKAVSYTHLTLPTNREV